MEIVNFKNPHADENLQDIIKMLQENPPEKFMLIGIRDGNMAKIVTRNHGLNTLERHFLLSFSIHADMYDFFNPKE
jgi:hypothetical protein